MSATAVAGAIDLAKLHDLAELHGAFVVRDAGRHACGVLAFPPCPRPPVVAIRGAFCGETFRVCHWHQARILGRRRWTTTTVTPAPRDRAEAMCPPS